MNIFQNQFSVLNTIFRSIPFTLPILIIIQYYFYKNMYIFYLFCGTIIINFLCVPLSKKLCIPLGNYLSNIFNTEDLPFIGRFTRPIGATNTGCFYINDTNYTTTSGMPSGHCILTTFICIYLYYYIINKYNISKKKYKYILLSILLFITIYMAYTRVLMNCHTVQQTIIGSIIGFIFGYYYYFYIKKNVNKYKK